jgi:hypothetical protein
MTETEEVMKRTTQGTRDKGLKYLSSTSRNNGPTFRNSLAIATKRIVVKFMTATNRDFASPDAVIDKL